jgi:hypothetical protein
MHPPLKIPRQQVLLASGKGVRDAGLHDSGRNEIGARSGRIGPVTDNCVYRHELTQ